VCSSDLDFNTQITYTHSKQNDVTVYYDLLNDGEISAYKMPNLKNKWRYGDTGVFVTSEDFIKIPFGGSSIDDNSRNIVNSYSGDFVRKTTTRVVSSIASLRLITNVALGDVVDTISYYGDNNGGGNRFTLVSLTSGGYTDNGGTVIVDDAGRVWEAVESDVVRFSDFGVKLGDDTAMNINNIAISKLIQYVKDSAVAGLFVKKIIIDYGNIYLSEGIDLSELNYSIDIEGSNDLYSVIYYKNTIPYSGTMLNLGNATCSISNIHITSPSVVNSYARGIDASQVTNSQFLNVKIQRATEYSIKIGKWNNKLIRVKCIGYRQYTGNNIGFLLKNNDSTGSETINNLSIFQCDSKDNMVGVLCRSNNNNNVVISQSGFEVNNSLAISFEQGSYGLSIIDNYFEANGKNGYVSNQYSNTYTVKSSENTYSNSLISKAPVGNINLSVDANWDISQNLQPQFKNVIIERNMFANGNKEGQFWFNFIGSIKCKNNFFYIQNPAYDIDNVYRFYGAASPKNTSKLIDLECINDTRNSDIAADVKNIISFDDYDFEEASNIILESYNPTIDNKFSNNKFINLNLDNFIGLNTSNNGNYGNKQIKKVNSGSSGVITLDLTTLPYSKLKGKGLRISALGQKDLVDITSKLIIKETLFDDSIIDLVNQIPQSNNSLLIGEVDYFNNAFIPIAYDSKKLEITLEANEDYNLSMLEIKDCSFNFEYNGI